MINEIIYMEMRLLQQFCQKYKCKSKEANSLFNTHGIWKYIEDCYDTLHMNGDGYILNDIDEILIAKGVALTAEEVINISENLKITTIELILTDAIDDYSKKTGRPVSEVRNEIIESGAYDDIYDYETGLWTQGPDYFIDYFKQLQAKE